MPCVLWNSKTNPETTAIRRNRAIAVVAEMRVSMHTEGDAVVQFGLKVDDKDNRRDEKA